mmetsp:Transcript_3295/g.6594  ORF Transcript_3295/g.6594 Transcript_3295/m.6594 type:complete len:267 (+) Transcript_3295:666-1466(+)
MPLPPLTIEAVARTLDRLKEVPDGEHCQHTTQAQKEKLLRPTLAAARNRRELGTLVRMVKGKRVADCLSHNLLLRALAYTFVLAPRISRISDAVVSELVDNANVGASRSANVEHAEAHSDADLYRRMDAMTKVIRKAFAHCQSYAGLIAALFDGSDETTLLDSITQQFPPSELCSIVVSQFSQPSSAPGPDSVTLDEVRSWIVDYFCDSDGSASLESVRQHINQCASKRVVPCAPVGADDFRDVIRGLEKDEKIIVDEDQVYLLCY